MERIKGFPCSKCKILTAGDVISKTKELRNKRFYNSKSKSRLLWNRVCRVFYQIPTSSL